MKSRVSKLETAAEAAEQYSRRNCLRISGYREDQNENTDNIVLDITSKLNTNLEIDRGHRAGRPKDTKPRDIIVKVYTFRARRKVYEALKIIVVVVLSFYVHGKHLRLCRDGQFT